ncbi:uncharacterized protein LOC144159939 [Haemaphysalis longicornis]
MAVVDSQYKYVMIDVGAEGRKSDGGIFKDSKFGRALANGTLDIPSLGLLPGTSATAEPFAFVGDEALQLRKDFLRPFPSKQLRDERRVFNNRLSRERRCAENAFGITAARWRILFRTIPLQPGNVDFVIKGACVMHNFLTVQNTQSSVYMDSDDSFGNVVAGHWRRSVQEVQGDGAEPGYFPLETTHARNFPSEAAEARNLFTAYFCSDCGEVPWQWSQPGVLSPLVGKTSTHVKDAGHFVEIVSEVPIDRGDRLVSFDVVSLITSVPVSLAVATITSSLEDDDSLSSRTCRSVGAMRYANHGSFYDVYVVLEQLLKLRRCQRELMHLTKSLIRPNTYNSPCEE